MLNEIERADPLVEIVLAKIKTAILTGQLQTGDRLVETKMGEQFGVSRGPVREAFRRLEQMNLIEKTTYRGATVSILIDRDILELQSMRVPLEGRAARLLAERRDSRAVAHLEGVVMKMGQVVEADDKIRVVTLDLEFHDSPIRLVEHNLRNETWAVVSAQRKVVSATAVPVA